MPARLCDWGTACLQAGMSLPVMDVAILWQDALKVLAGEGVAAVNVVLPVARAGSALATSVPIGVYEQHARRNTGERFA
eukprot:352223-Chlamydomonas_euryale.AAC.9